MRRILLLFLLAGLANACSPAVVSPTPTAVVELPAAATQPPAATAPATPTARPGPTAGVPTESAPVEVSRETPTTESPPTEIAPTEPPPTEPPQPTETPLPLLDGIPVTRNDDGLFVLGQPDAPVTVLDYGDFQ